MPTQQPSQKTTQKPSQKTTQKPSQKAKQKPSYTTTDDVLDIRHTEATRKNIPPAGLAASGKVAKEKKLQYAYNPHLPPRLLFDPTGRADRLKELLDDLGTRELSQIVELRVAKMQESDGLLPKQAP